MILATTAIESTWGTNQDLVFLGEWCAIYDRKHVLNERNFVMLDYHWDDREKLAGDVKYLQVVNTVMIKELARALNQLHGVDHSERYWQLLLGYWLTQFIAIVFDRWTMLERAISNYHDLETFILPFSKQEIVANDSVKARDFFVEDTWNHAIFAELIQQWTKIKSTTLSCTSSVVDVHKEKQEQRSKFIHMLKRGLVQLSQTVNRKQDYVLFHSGLSKKADIKLQLKLGQLPGIWTLPKNSQYEYNESLRNWKVQYSDSNTLFENMICSMIPQHLPKIFIEGYADAAQTSLGCKLPVKPKVIFTSGEHFCNDAFKIWAGNQLDKGTRLVIGQHGSGAFHKFNGATSFELSVSDAYISTGNGNGMFDHVKDVGRFNNVMKLDGWNSQGPALLATVAMPRYSFDLRAMAIAGQMLEYFNDQFLFFESLPEHIRDEFLVRIYPAGDYGWCQKKRWIDQFPDVKIDNGDEAMHVRIKSSRLFISTYNATTYNETLAANVPTIMYWNPNHWEVHESAVPYFEELRTAGIFHHSPESAAKQVAMVWDDVAGWWNREDLQVIRRRFCRRYAHLPASILDDLTNVLQDEARMSPR